MIYDILAGKTCAQVRKLIINAVSLFDILLRFILADACTLFLLHFFVAALPSVRSGTFVLALAMSVALSWTLIVS